MEEIYVVPIFFKNKTVDLEVKCLPIVKDTVIYEIGIINEKLFEEFEGARLVYTIDFGSKNDVIVENCSWLIVQNNSKIPESFETRSEFETVVRTCQWFMNRLIRN